MITSHCFLLGLFTWKTTTGQSYWTVFHEHYVQDEKKFWRQVKKMIQLPLQMSSSFNTGNTSANFTVTLKKLSFTHTAYIFLPFCMVLLFTNIPQCSFSSTLTLTHRDTKITDSWCEQVQKPHSSHMTLKINGNFLCVWQFTKSISPQDLFLGSVFQHTWGRRSIDWGVWRLDYFSDQDSR